MMSLIKTLTLSTLTTSILLWNATAAHALEALTDTGMSSVTGQDGIHISASMDNATIGKVAWEDESRKELQFNNASITGLNATNPVKTDFQINMGSSATGQPSLSAELVMSAMTFAADEVALGITNSVGDTISKNVLGKLAFKTTKDTLVKLNTSAGLFNEQGNINLEVKLDGADIFLTESQNLGATVNQLILSDTRLHAKVDGKLYVSDTEGLVLEASRIILVPDGSRAGLQAAFMLKGDITEGGTNTDAALSKNFSLDGAKGLIRLGVSGQVNVTKATLRGTDAENTASLDDTTLSVLGKRGVAFSVEGELEDAGSTPLSFDISEAGKGGYGVRFSKLKAFNPQDLKAKYTLGNTYLNILNVNSLSIPETKLSRAAGNSNQINGLYVAKQLASTSDFTYSVPSTRSIAFMTRGLSLQGVPQKAQFIKNNTNATNTTTANEWSLAPMLHNLNANLTLTGGGAKTLETSRSRGDVNVDGVKFDNVLSMSLAVTTEGVNETDTNPNASIDNKGLLTTSILLIDPSTSADKPLQTYVGLRNIDTLLTARGDLGISKDVLIMNFSHFNLVFAGEFAAGALPTNNAGDIANRFNNQNDTLTGMRGRINAEFVNMELRAGENTDEGNFVGYEADIKLQSDGSSFFHLVDTVDSTTIGLDQLKGRIRILNGRGDITPNQSVNFQQTLVINPLNRSDEVLEIGALNLYPSKSGGVGDAQRLAGAVITGGKLDVDLTLKPVNAVNVPSYP